ncbi:MAG: FAD-dependent oxidoreductase [Rhabdochlamydiaceae bacterium]
MRVAIVGAGFAGLSVAWHLQEAGCDVTLFERKGIGAGASGIATGLIHPYVGEEGRRSLFASEGLEAAKALITASEEKSGKKILLQKGIIRHIQNEEQRQMFLSHSQTFADIRQHGENSFWIDSGMTIDSSLYLEALWETLSEKGVKLLLNEVSELSSLKGFDQIVVTAGAGVKQFPELSSLPTSLLKGQVLKCQVPKSVALPETSSIGKGYVALTQDRTTCVIGSTYERGELTPTPQPGLAKSRLFPKIAAFFPAVDQLEVIDCQAAFRVTRHGHYLPLATRVKDNIWVLTALGSRGLLYHAYFGKLLALDLLKMS